MSPKKGKIDTTKTLLIAYFVMSAIFILMSAISVLKNGVYNVGVQDGIGTAVNKIVSQAGDKECRPFSVWVGDKEVSLINVACLQKAAPQGGSQTPEVAPVQ